MSKRSSVIASPVNVSSSSSSFQELLVLLWRKGPETEGVFRTACNSKNLNAVRDQLNSGVAVDLEALPVTLLVGLLKVNMLSLLQQPFMHPYALL